MSGMASERLRFWEIDPLFQCPIVGVCLSRTEQRRLLRQAGLLTEVSTPFEMHEALVSAAHAEGRLSVLADALLERKYKDQAASLWVLPEKELLARWRVALDAGEHAGVLWTVSARPDLSCRVKREIFGSLHMLMHASLEQIGDLRRSLARENERNAELDAARRDAIEDRERLEKELLRHCTGHESSEVAGLKARVHELERQRAARERSMAALLRDNERLAAELATQRRTCDAIGLDGGTERMRNSKGCGGGCPAQGLCGRRILIVGGLDRMETGYRSLVQSHGGICEHHNGQVRGGRRRLETSVRRADLVICLADCNSHAACSAVKVLGKKLGKPVRMLGNSSLNSVSEVLRESADRS